jgi:hypothetical protein
MGHATRASSGVTNRYLDDLKKDAARRIDRR